MTVTRDSRSNDPKDPNMEESFDQASRRTSGEQAGQRNQQQNAGPKPKGLGGMLGFGKRRRNFQRSSAGEEVAAYASTVRQLIKEVDEGGDSGINALVIDGNQSGLSASALVITMAAGESSRDVAVFTLLLEASVGARLSPRQVSFGPGQNSEFQTTCGDLYDDWFVTNVIQTVKERFGEDTRVHDAGHMTVPRETTHDDRERVRKVLFMADNALTGCLSSVMDAAEPPFTIRDIDPSVQLNGILDYDVVNDETITGLPIRSDVSLQLQGVAKVSQAAQHQAVVSIAKVDGYIDLVFDPTAQNQQASNPFGAPVSPMPNNAPRYYPRFIITRSDSEVDEITPELQLLGLASSTMLSWNFNWAGVFLPNYNANAVDLRDIGAVGREVDIMGTGEFKPIDTKSENFKPEHLQQLIQMLVHDRLVYSMDVEESGELSWVHSTFIDAALNKAGATASIIRTVDNLTGGLFSRKFGNRPIVHDDNNRIHLGYWVDENDQKRDIRELDYLAMANWLGPRDMSMVRRFADTFEHSQIPIEMRLEERERIYSLVLANKYEIKGYARRLTFTPEFIACLHSACEEAGLIIRPTNIAQNFGTLGVRGDPSIHNFAVSGMSGNMFQSQNPYGNYNSRQSFGGFNNGGYWN